MHGNMNVQSIFYSRTEHDSSTAKKACLTQTPLAPTVKTAIKKRPKEELSASCTMK
jgi:hypothetical protein